MLSTLWWRRKFKRIGLPEQSVGLSAASRDNLLSIRTFWLHYTSPFVAGIFVMHLRPSSKGSSVFSRLLNHYRDSYRGLPFEVWLISIVVLINRSGTMVVPFLMLFLTGEREFTPTLAGLLFGLFGLGGVAGNLLGSRLAARFGSLRVQIFALILSAPFFVTLLWFREPISLAVNLLLLALVGEAVRPATMAATAEYSLPEIHARAFGLNRLAANLGMTIGPALAGILYQDYLPWIFFLDAATCLGAAFTLIAFRHRFVPRHQRVLPGITTSKERSRRDWHLIVAVGLYLPALVIFFQITTVFPLFLRRFYGMSEFVIGLMLAVNTIVIVCAEMPLIHALRNRHPLATTAIGTSLSCLGFGLLPYGEGILFCVFTVLLWTLGEMLMMPMMMAFVSQVSTSENRASRLGWISSVFALSFVLAPLIWPTLYDLNPTLPFTVSLSFVLPLGACFMLLARIRRMPDREPAKLAGSPPTAAKQHPVDLNPRSSSLAPKFTSSIAE
jgi:predicted MFS family arabinose efflux permease